MQNKANQQTIPCDVIGARIRNSDVRKTTSYTRRVKRINLNCLPIGVQSNVRLQLHEKNLLRKKYKRAI